MRTLADVHATGESLPRVECLESLPSRVLLHISNIMAPCKDLSLLPLAMTPRVRKGSTPISSNYKRQMQQAKGESQIRKDKGRWALRKILCPGRAQHGPGDAQLMMSDGIDGDGYHLP